ncbi:MAG: hypothetical protein AB7N71_02260, partial [Phycisphaerae bacterium]
MGENGRRQRPTGFVLFALALNLSILGALLWLPASMLGISRKEFAAVPRVLIEHDEALNSDVATDPRLPTLNDPSPVASSVPDENANAQISREWSSLLEIIAQQPEPTPASQP